MLFCFYQNNMGENASKQWATSSQVQGKQIGLLLLTGDEMDSALSCGL